MENQSEKTTQPADNPDSNRDSPPHHPHDLLFKAVFKRTNNVRALLKTKAPENILAVLDLDTIRLDDGSYVDENFQEDITDVVVLCDTIHKKPVQFPFIFEHKSDIPSYAPFQIMHYQDRLWLRQIQAKDMKPTPIVPVLFYHGKKTWKIKPWKAYLQGWDEAFAPYTPSGDCIFIDLSGMTDEEIMGYEEGFMVTALLLMKHRFEREYLFDKCGEIISFVATDENELPETRIANLKYAMNYLRSIERDNWGKILKKIRTMEYVNQTADIDEYIRNEGYKEGKQEEAIGILISLFKHFPDASDETIARMTGKPVKFIAQVRKKMKLTNGK